MVHSVHPRMFLVLGIVQRAMKMWTRGHISVSLASQAGSSQTWSQHSQLPIHDIGLPSFLATTWAMVGEPEPIFSVV